MRRSRHDRHGRAARADNDRRRRPSDGFRAAHGARFSDLVSDAIAELPDQLADAVAGLEVVIADVPEVDDTILNSRDVPLAQVRRGGRPGARGGAAHQLVVYRRPLELRAVTRTEIIDLTRVAIGREVARAFGIEDDGLYDESEEW